MRQHRSERIKKQTTPGTVQHQEGYSLVEILLAMCIFLPLMIGASQLFEVGVSQQAQEQSSVEVNMDATAGFNMMMMEIAQAGSHSDASTVIANMGSGVTGSAFPQTVTVASVAGFNVGDYVDAVNASGSRETVKVTAVGEKTLTGVFLNSYVNGDDIRMFALPYKEGILTPAVLNPNSATNVTALRFFGDIYGDGNIHFVEYVYDASNRQITRSITRSDAAQKGAAVPLITHVQNNSVRFTLHTDVRGVVTAVTASMTLENDWRNDGGQLEQIRLSSKVVIPSTRAASLLHYETLRYGGIDMLPSTPSFVAYLKGSTYQ